MAKAHSCHFSDTYKSREKSQLRVFPSCGHSCQLGCRAGPDLLLQQIQVVQNSHLREKGARNMVIATWPGSFSKTDLLLVP